METTKIIGGKEVVFETGDTVDNHGHVSEVQLVGHTLLNGSWRMTHIATGVVSYTGEIVDVLDIEDAGELLEWLESN